MLFKNAVSWIGVFLICLTLIGVPSMALAQEEVFVVRQWAIDADATSQYGDDAWSARQATGAPNSADCTDQGTAWASSSSTGQDSLTLSYDIPVVPTQIDIYQNYNPGAITAVALILADGSGMVEIANLPDTETACPGVLTIDVPEGTAPVDGIVITLDQTITASWNEIDAVELVGEMTAGQEIDVWANRASATTQFSHPGWSALQSVGLPDTAACGDYATAWASSSSQGQDSLTVYFPVAVIPTRLDIYQSYTPGSITGVDLIYEDYTTTPVENSADPGTACLEAFSLALTEELPVVGAVIHLDQTGSASWNEIDAVEIAGAFYGDGYLHQWAAEASATSQFGEVWWSAAQATGAPDTLVCSDQTTAWASLTSTGRDSLTLTYEIPVIPFQINIYQTYNPGAITGIELVLADGSGTVEIATPSNTETACPGVLAVLVRENTGAIVGVTITLDQSSTGNWNEIDAVELLGTPVEAE